MKVKIKVYQNELESVLDRIQIWGSQYEWSDNSPNFYIELDVLPFSEDSDRFVVPAESTVAAPEVAASYGLVEMLKAKKVQPAKSQMDELRTLLKGE